MLTLRIEHAVTDFGKWKALFDSDPLQRKESGVLGYRIEQPIDDDRSVIIDLDFGERSAAQAFVERLQALWASTGPAQAVWRDPRTRILDVIEKVDL
jgi:hypothetical protein